MEHLNFIIFLLLFVSHFMSITALRCYVCSEEHCKTNKEDAPECPEGSCVAVRKSGGDGIERHCFIKKDAETYCRSMRSNGSSCRFCHTDLCNNKLPKACKKTGKKAN